MQIPIRQRKKLRTRASIETAVLDLVGASTLEAVTIESIAAEAECTPRTFFNHFASKEDALLGVPRQDAPIEIDLEQVPGVAAASTPFELGSALVRAQLSAFDQEQLRVHALRDTVLQRYPHLVPRQFERFDASLAATTKTLDDALARFGAPPGRARFDHARMISLTLGVAVRLAIESRCRVDQPTELLSHFDHAVESISALFDAPLTARRVQS